MYYMDICILWNYMVICIIWNYMDMYLIYGIIWTYVLYGLNIISVLCMTMYQEHTYRQAVLICELYCSDVICNNAPYHT